MAKQYKYRAALNIISGGYPGEDTGTVPANDPWHTADLPAGGEAEFEYYYRDSNQSQNANSSRVRVKVKDTWTASVNNANVITVTVKSVITSITRDDVRGTPGLNPNTAKRNLYIRREEGAPVIRSFVNDDINTAHTIFSGELVLDTYSFTLEPGTEMNRGTIYFVNTITGHENDPLPNIYTDALWIGITFLNPLPADYRPGERKLNNTWMSHNRAAGKCERKVNGTWTEMRTNDGGVGTDNPPFRKHNGVWYNMKQIGLE